jgi:hypothetical protein
MKIIYLKNEKIEYEKIGDITDKLDSRNIQLGDYVTLGNYVTLGDYVTLGKYQVFSSNSLYKYVVSAYQKDRVQIIQLGCRTQTRQEWESNFWNNDNEFPNNGSEKSIARLRAFKVACFFLDSIEPY